MAWLGMVRRINPKEEIVVDQSKKRYVNVFYTAYSSTFTGPHSFRHHLCVQVMWTGWALRSIHDKSWSLYDLGSLPSTNWAEILGKNTAAGLIGSDVWLAHTLGNIQTVR
jgi:hypothetical protein